MKTFNAIGTSHFNGQVKIRFANGAVNRARHLRGVGHTNVKLVETGTSASKQELLNQLLAWEALEEHFSSEEIAVLKAGIGSAGADASVLTM